MAGMSRFLIRRIGRLREKGGEMSGGVVHLWRNVCDGCMMWCGCKLLLKGTLDGSRIDEIELPEMADGAVCVGEVTCLECLKTASEFGDAIRVQREKLGGSE